MRWLAWTMLMAIAMGAGAIGIEREFNPVRTHPHSSPQEAIHRIIVKLRAGSAAATAEIASERVAALLVRRGMHVRATRAITPAMYALRVDPAVAGESITATLERLRADPEVEYAEA